MIQLGVNVHGELLLDLFRRHIFHSNWLIRTSRNGLLRFEFRIAGGFRDRVIRDSLVAGEYALDVHLRESRA